MSAREIARLMNEEDQNVLRAMHSAEEKLAIAGEHAGKAFLEGARVIYVGAGTSGRVAFMDAAEMPLTFGLEPGRFVVLHAGHGPASSVYGEDAEDMDHAAIEDLNAIDANRSDVMVALAASGKTPYVLAAVRHAKQKGIWTCGIANNRNAVLLREVDHGILLDTGAEVLTGSTRLKAATAQKLALNMISTIAMVLSGKVIENLMVDVKARNQKLKERCVRIVRELSTVTQHEAEELLEANDWSIRRVLALVRPNP